MDRGAAELQWAGIALDSESKYPMYCQLYEVLRHAILESRIRPGQRLPATRKLAGELGVSRNTVLLAFDCLLAEGYLEGRTGSGTYVTETLPENLLHASRSPAETPHSIQRKRTLSKRGQQIADIPIAMPLNVRPFQHGAPAVRDFPFDIWSRILTRQLRTLSETDFGYGDPVGYRPLREALANYLRAARSVKCEVEQIIIVNGSQQALDLAARVLLDAGEIAWLEDPGYLGARKALGGAGIELVPVPVDQEGMNVEEGVKRARDARMAYVTPSHQYPLGVTMSVARRLQLLEWARDSCAWILEDDYDSEYRYAGRPLASLQGLDVNNRVIYIGTFSKVLFPAMRLGYVVVPYDLIHGFLAAKAVSDRNSHTLEQAVLAEFIREGHFGRHIRRMRVLYQQRQQALIEAVNAELAGKLEIDPSDSGMHLVGWLPDGVDDQEISKRALELELTVPGLSMYSLGSSRPGLVLGYAAFSEEEIREGIVRLASLL
ncbi:PLP-dependent aminotransferase family protein [bacterium]|nr:PLP-dependent aminotransferase family protein [bacterium]